MGVDPTQMHFFTFVPYVGELKTKKDREEERGKMREDSIVEEGRESNKGHCGSLRAWQHMVTHLSHSALSPPLMTLKTRQNSFYQINSYLIIRR
jgi:hypothetical protein